jgi:hypothetical protein
MFYDILLVHLNLFTAKTNNKLIYNTNDADSRKSFEMLAVITKKLK